VKLGTFDLVASLQALRETDLSRSKASSSPGPAPASASSRYFTPSVPALLALVSSYS
jgi:hypothetical protein